MNKIVTILVILLIALFVLFSILISIFLKGGELEVTTEYEEYNNIQNIELKIVNNSKVEFCFSSCYPYYIEKFNTSSQAWDKYEYVECETLDLIEICISPGETKGFEAEVGTLEKGEHRMSIPICKKCNKEEIFQKDDLIYSNNFNVK